MSTYSSQPLVVRSNLDFGIGSDTPRYWFRSNPYLTRIFDGVSMMFPDGERTFISSLRPFRPKITDAKLAQEVADFCRQEGQHGIQHSLVNDMLEGQGIPVQRLLTRFKQNQAMMAEKFSPEMQLAMTSAAEHLTALIAEAFFSDPEVMADADPRMRALFAWHAIEEMEHRSVAYDVMIKVAKVGYFKRIGAMTLVHLGFWRQMLYQAHSMLKADGFSRDERRQMARENLPVLFGRQGIMTAVLGPLLSYYRPGFHPEDIPVLRQYPIWRDVFERTGDPLLASEALQAA